MCGSARWRLISLEWGCPGSSSSTTRRLSLSKFHFPTIINVPICVCDFTLWTQPVSSPSAERCRLASGSYVDANPSTGSIFTLVETHQVEISVGTIIDVSVNSFGEYLMPMSVYDSFDRFPNFFDASRFCHKMRISGHLTETGMGVETQLTCAGAV